MSDEYLLLLLVLFRPLLVVIIVVVTGIVAIVALCRVNPEDVPAVLKECSAMFRRLSDRSSGPPALRDASDPRTVLTRASAKKMTSPDMAPEDASVEEDR